MDITARVAHRPARWKVALPLLAVAPLSVLLLLLTNGNLALVLAPLCVLAGLALIVFGRVRTSAMLLLIALLTLENPSEAPAAGLWRSPFFILGALVMDKLNNVTGFRPLRFTGVDVLLALLFAVLFYRWARGIEIDRVNQVETASVLRGAALVSLASVFGLWGFGLATGGDFQNSLFQIHPLLIVCALFFLFQAALLGPSDHQLLARIVVGAALWKAAIGLYVKHTLNLPISALPFVNTHSDSVLYATATTLLVAAFFFAPTRARLLRCVLFLPPLLMAMIANNRRLVWLEVGATLAGLAILMPRNRIKRQLLRLLVAASPVMLLYLGAGWNSDSRIFVPVAMTKSVVNSDTDSSSRSRDVENFNLVMTFAQGMLLGKGFGHEYSEVVKGDDISKIFPQYRYLPHNSLLGLWAFGGMLGFTGLMAMLTCGAFLAARCLRMAKTPDDRVSAFMTLAVICIFVIQGYGDIGIFSWIPNAMLAAAIASVGKLAVSLGAWPDRRRAIEAAPG